MANSKRKRPDVCACERGLPQGNHSSDGTDEHARYQYVRSFEQPDHLLPNTFIVVRIDGRGFTKLTTKYNFVKPNDRRALDLMNVAAEAVMKDLPDLVLAYGQSDEFRFPPTSDLSLDMCRSLRTGHINNLYNTTFWALVQQGGLENRTAEKELSGTVSADKNEILFSRFGINYNNEPEIFKKGSVLYRDRPVKPISHSASASLSARPPNAAAPPYRPSPKRSPSMSVLDLGLANRAPPQIPLRISSIPVNASPRKLSLPSQKSYALLRQEAEATNNSGASGSALSNTAAHRGPGGRPRTPPQPLMTMKELPSPPTGYDDSTIRSSVMGSEPQPWSASPPPTRGSGHGVMESLIVNPVIPPSPPSASVHSHERERDRTADMGGRATPSSYSFPAPPPHASSREQFARFDWSSPPSRTSTADAATKEADARGQSKKAKKVLGVDDATWTPGLHGNEGRPVQMSKTAREKERKKRGKARIVTEHVDIIGDGFWERRGWILSGRAG
ncbi:tRNA-His guanylyltransferase [Kalmusia sp. IMI 367209]|nr:tRNA-His guanylyltransferase [Kalmusia sp. IMI 367209]